MEGIRFDTAYDTMPWHKVDTVVFDIGNILIRYAPKDFLQILFPDDPGKQAHMLSAVYNGKYWPNFDRGTMGYDEAAAKLSAEFGYPESDYLHALRGWIELKTPIEEGWRAAARCKRAGKRLWLLSNYPEEGYCRLRKKYADLFECFEGGTISCRVHLCKPEPEIYARLAEDTGLDPARTLFIDDTLKNVEAACRYGIHGYHMHESGMMDRFFI